MIKKISGLCLLCCLVLAAAPTIQAQNAKKKKLPKKELLMNEDDLVKALTRIGIAIQEMEKENKDENLDLIYLDNLCLSKPNDKIEKSDELAQVLNSRFDRIELLLNDMMLLAGQGKQGKNIVIQRSKQTPKTVATESLQQEKRIEELEKQIKDFELRFSNMQEQIETLKSLSANSSTNPNLDKLLDQITSLNLELQKQNKKQNKMLKSTLGQQQGAYLTDNGASQAEISRLRKSEDDLEKELHEMRKAQVERENLRNSQANFVAVIPGPKSELKEQEVQLPKETSQIKEEIQETAPEKKEPKMEMKLPTKKEFLSETEPSKKTEQELGDGLSKKENKKQIFFAFDSSKLSAEAKTLLDKTAVQINEKRSVTATILGLSSPEGNPAYNKRLAEKRSKEVYNYLLSKGVSTDRIKILDSDIDNVAATPSYGRRVEISLEL